MSETSEHAANQNQTDGTRAQTSEYVADDSGKRPTHGNPAKKITQGVILLLVVMGGLYALSDRMAPSSSRGVVSANVLQIAPRVSGEVTEVMVNDDAVVQAGDPFFSIDARPFELAVKQAEANLATAGQGINASTASLVAAQAVVTQARTRLDSARTDGERILQLEKRSLVSRSQGDTARATVADAKAQVTAANANLQSARAQLGPNGADNPAILAAGAKLETAQYDLASTVVKASHFGVSTNVTLSPGHFISAGNPGLTFIDANAAWITVDLRENPLQDVQPGDPAHLLFDAIPGTIFEGRVQSTSALLFGPKRRLGGRGPTVKLHGRHVQSRCPCSASFFR